jgi:hypothetical protein
MYTERSDNLRNYQWLCILYTEPFDVLRSHAHFRKAANGSVSMHDSNDSFCKIAEVFAVLV